jgi:hypothetical protein
MAETFNCMGEKDYEKDDEWYKRKNKNIQKST